MGYDVNKNFDFDTITYSITNKELLLRLLIQKYQYVLDAIEEYYKQKFNGITPLVTPTVKARIITLCMAIQEGEI